MDQKLLNLWAVVIRDDGQASRFSYLLNDLTERVGRNPQPVQGVTPSMLEPGGTGRQTNFGTGNTTASDLRFSVVDPWVQDVLQQEGIKGQRLDLMMGYQGLGLEDYSRIYTGVVEAVELRRDGLTWDVTVIDLLRSADRQIFGPTYDGITRYYNALEMALRVLVTTPGGNGEWDAGVPGFGLGIPEELVDVAAFESLIAQYKQEGLIFVPQSDAIGIPERPRFAPPEQPVSSGVAWVQQILNAVGCFLLVRLDGSISANRLWPSPPTLDFGFQRFDENNLIPQDGGGLVSYSDAETINSYALRIPRLAIDEDGPGYNLVPGTYEVENTHAVQRSREAQSPQLGADETTQDILDESLYGGGWWKMNIIRDAVNRLSFQSWPAPIWELRAQLRSIGTEVGDGIVLSDAYFKSRGYRVGNSVPHPVETPLGIHPPPEENRADLREGFGRVSSVALQWDPASVVIKAQGYFEPDGARFRGRNVNASPDPALIRNRQDFIQFDPDNDPGTEFPGTRIPEGFLRTWEPETLWRGVWMVECRFLVEVTSGTGGLDNFLTTQVWARAHFVGKDVELTSDVGGFTDRIQGPSTGETREYVIFLFSSGHGSLREQSIAETLTLESIDWNHRTQEEVGGQGLLGEVRIAQVIMHRPTWGDYDPGIYDPGPPPNPGPVIVEEETGQFGGE